MTLIRLDKCPFPYFGGKSDAALAVWQALGDPVHYVEPFAGSLAVLLRRPHPCNRTYYSETVCDLDGLLINAWRSIQLSPEETAEAASWPVAEADLHARHLALLRWREERNLERLMADPDWHDPTMGGWRAWGQSCWIGGGWCAGNGAWIVGDDGRITKRRSKGEPGMKRPRPNLSAHGRGVTHPQAREQGVIRQLPHLSAHGQGVNRPQAREPGVHRQLPHLGNDGKGVNRPQAREPGMGEPEYHPMTMPELLRWFQFLSARLRHVRIVNGDWRRVVTTGATKTINVRSGDGVAGIFLDPPYSSEAGRCENIYSEEDLSVAHAAREWCKEHGDDPDYRIVLAGFDTEHAELENLGWRVVEWYRAGFLKGGMGNLGKTSKNQQHRERLWLSPHCQRESKQASLF